MANTRTLGILVIGLALVAGPALAEESAQRAPGFVDVVKQSLFGNVYATPSTWKPLSTGSFFTEGWNRPWASPPPGEGGAPRQGWLNAFDGVFYRLGVATGSFASNFHGNGNQYTGGLTLYTPFNARSEVRLDVPFVVSSREEGGSDYHTHFGDFQIAPRFLISESTNFTQSFEVTFRTPTGSGQNGNDLSSGTPTWEFWWNPWSKLVLRGGMGLSIPFNDRSTIAETFIGNLAAGYYFTPHTFTPLGDLVFYLSGNLSQPINDRGGDAVFTLTPGFRTHLGMDWYLLGGVEVPVTHPKPFEYKVLGGLMKVF